ncbi:MAG: sigma 54-interacting transcriptional regulator, partial [Bacteroidota bacterium]
MLERELVSFESNKSADRTNELLEEIRRYKGEIHALSSKQDDMEEAVITDSETISEMKQFEGIVYEGRGAMQSVIAFISKIADSDATVLILGESGTGKEMVA